MTKREKLTAPKNNYFNGPKSNLKFVSTGCTILDCALGGGYVLGRITNIVGDKCLSGDTVVSVQRGMSRPRKMTLQTLFQRVNGTHGNRNDDTETHLVADIGGYVGTARMLSVQQTGVKTLYEIINEHGNSIKATEDHQFATVEGWKRLSDGLSVGSIIKQWRGTRNVERPQRIRKYRSSTSGVVFHPFGQQNIAAGRDYKRVLTARLVIEAAINDLSLCELVHILRNDSVTAASLQYTDPAMDIHHLNGDCTDDRLENLQLIDPQDHWQIHAGEMPTNVKRIELAKITSITEIGTEPTFDVTMEGPYHNFIANGFVVHNSTAKTALATEALTNFVLRYKGNAAYRETEAAFDRDYAAAMGLPVDKVDFGDPEKPLTTVEDFERDLSSFVEKQGTKPGIYVLDSLDALSDEAEMERDIGEATYGGNKAKALSTMFRKMARRIERSNVLLLVISQVRDNIGAMFGEKHKRSGGKALDFYASQIMWLAHIKTLKKTINKVERPYGVVIKANIKKNKVAMPFRQCDFEFHFGYGVEDMLASLAWLKEVGRLGDLNIKESEYKAYLTCIGKMSDADYQTEQKMVAESTVLVWQDIENTFIPKRSKYASP